MLRKCLVRWRPVSGPFGKDWLPFLLSGANETQVRRHGFERRSRNKYRTDIGTLILTDGEIRCGAAAFVVGEEPISSECYSCGSLPMKHHAVHWLSVSVPHGNKVPGSMVPRELRRNKMEFATPVTSQIIPLEPDVNQGPQWCTPHLSELSSKQFRVSRH